MHTCLQYPSFFSFLLCLTFPGEVEDDDGMPALLRYSCCHWIREQRPLWKSMTTVQGHKMPYSYFPLSKEQLVWYITTNDVAICVNTEHSELMQASILSQENTASDAQYQHTIYSFCFCLYYLDRQQRVRSNGC